MFVKQLNSFTVAQLKDELNSRDLETTGKKAELVVRLATFLEGNWYCCLLSGDERDAV